jgi:NDP-sugar pyrophosphorylase family protein
MPTIVIPLSGLGQRFVDAGYESPKPLIIIDNKPIIEHVINLFDKEKDDYIFICNDLHLKETNMREILLSICPNCKIFEVPVRDRKGPVHAVSLIFDNISDSQEIIVSYCDYGTWWSYEKFLKDNRDRNSDGSVACYKGFHPHMLGTDNYAFLKETKQGSRWMEKIQEKKPFTQNKMNEYASNGTYYFKNGKIMKKYFQKLMDLRLTIKNEYYVSMVYNLLADDGLKVNIFEIEKMLQWGTPYDLEIYNSWSRYFENIINTQSQFVDNHNTTTILPLAGYGSRFSKTGYQEPKPLLKINNNPMVIQAIKCLPQSSHNIFICLDYHLKNYPLNDKIKEVYPESEIYGIKDVTEGQACTTEIGIQKSQIDLEKPILITACDNGVYYNVKKYQEIVDNLENDIIVWSFRNEPTSRNNPNMYAWMDVDKDNFVKHVSCKKFIEGVHDIKNSHVIIGTMFFRKAKYFMEGLKHNYTNNIRTNNEFYVDDVLNQNIEVGLNVKVFEVDNYICWGTPNDYETYLYWQNFFDECYWHPYKKSLDTTKYIIKENEILTLDNIEKYELISRKDENGRNIRLYSFYNVAFTGHSEYYPDILFKEEHKKGYILPIKEMTMSMKKKSYYEENGLKYVDNENDSDNDNNETIYVNEEVYYFIYNTENYYHFIYDTLPYLYCYLDKKKTNKNLKLLINYNKNKDKLLDYVKETYSLLDIQKEDIIFHNKKNKYKKIYLSNSLTHDGLSNMQPRKEIFDIYDILKTNALKDYKKDIKYDKIYISRRTWMNKHTDNIGTDYTTRRKLVNENELVEKLKILGFKEIFGENYSMKEKIRVFNSAKIVIGAIGGTITNNIFCSSDCRIITLVSPYFLDINYRMKYLLGKSEFIFGKLNSPDDEIPTNVRVKIVCEEDENYGCICEVVEKKHDKYLLNICNNNISFNSDETFKQILIEEKKFIKLDNGLNSPWRINLDSLKL